VAFGCTGPCKPVEGGTFTETNKSDPITWNTFGTSLSVAQHQIHNTHSDLLRHCSVYLPDEPSIVPGSGTLCPNLASSWTVTGGGTIWTFNLVKNATFPAQAPTNGRALNSSDVLYTFTQARDNPVTVFKSYYTDITNMQAPDPNTFVITIDKPLADFGQVVGNGDEFPGMVAPELAASMGTSYGTSQASLFDGTGPFLPGGGTKGSSYMLVKNPKYFLSGLGGMSLPHIDADRILIIPDNTAAEAAFVTGQLDLFGAPPPAAQNGPRIQAAHPDIILKVSKGLVLDAGGIFLNQGGMFPTATGNPAFKDVRVRQALQLLYPFQHIMNDYLGAAAHPSYTGCTPTAFQPYELSQAELKSLYVEDPVKAKDLLTQAGYSATHPLVVNEIEETGYSDTALAEDQALKAQLDATGIVTWNLQPIPLAEGTARSVKGTFEALERSAGSGGLAKTIDPFLTGAAENFAEWSTPQTDALIQASDVELDPAKRQQDFIDFNRICIAAAPKIPAPGVAGFTLQRGWVKNLGLNDPGYNNELWPSYLWIDHTGISS